MLPNLVLIILFFILPFIVIPQLPMAFETPKVIIAEVLIELLVLFSILKKGRLILTECERLPLVFLGVLFLVSLSGLVLNQEQVQLFGNVFRLQGIILFWHLLVLTLLVPKINFSEKFKLFPLLCLGGLLMATFIIGENRAGRSVGTLGEPNALAATAIVFLPFAFLNLKNKFFKLQTVLITLLIVLLSQSVSGLLAWLIVVLMILTVDFGKWSLSLVSKVCLLIVLLSLFLPFLGISKRPQAYSAASPYRFEDRAEIWKTAFIAGLEKPILGWGFGNTTIAIRTTSERLNNNLQYQFIDSSHNFLLDFWVQGGIMGFLTIVLLIHFSLTKLLLEKKLLETTLLLGVITVMLFNPMSIGILIAFWYVLGQGFKNNSL